MASHHQVMMKALGLPMVTPEPEVAQATMDSVRCKSLAHIVADLIAENEPMLTAECDGTTVTVRERGGGAAMRFTVEPGKSGGSQ